MEQVRKSRQPAGLALALAVGGIGLGVAAGEADAGSQRKILVLSVSEDGRQNEGLRSALGEHDDLAHALVFAKDSQWIAFNTGHMDLLSRPAVTQQVLKWLTPPAHSEA